MSAYIDWAGTADAAPYLKVNAGFAALGQALAFAHRPDADTGFVVGIGGGRYNVATYADATVTCVNGTNYIVAHRLTAALSASTGTTDWNNTATYGRVAIAVFASGVQTDFHDERFSAGGIFNHSAAGVSAVSVGITDAGGYWTGTEVETALQEAGLALAGKASTAYVDAAIAGLSWKQAVRVATTAAGTLASSFENGDTVDGVVLATGNRILIKNQAAGSENGIYTVNASGAPTRATDADSGAELVNASVYVSEGTTNADTQWTCTTNAAITVGSTSLAFAQLTSGGGVSSVDATGGVQTTSGSAITSTGTIRAAHVVNAQIGTSYAVVAGDRWKRVTFSNASSIAATIAQAGTTGFEDGYGVYLENIGVGAVTLTPTTSTVNGAATLVLQSGYSAILFSDGTNYRAFVIGRAGPTVNSQTGTSYTYLSGDRGKLVSHSNASAIAGTLPQGTGAFGSGWFMWVQNVGAGTLTITPTTSTIDGAASLALTTGQGALIVSDGTNYFTMRGVGGSAGLTNFTESRNTASPNATVPAHRLIATAAESNIDVVLSPKGTGALLAQLPDGTATGGNKRGTYAVDWQMLRTNAARVAAGNNGVIGGGSENTASTFSTVAGGGTNNASGQYSSIGGGQSNTSGGNTHTTVGGGNSNTASGIYATVGGGTTNTASAQTSSVLGGGNNTASATGATVIAGQGNTADGFYSLVGGIAGSARGIQGNSVFGFGSSLGTFQAGKYHQRRQTTGATATVLSADGAAPSTTTSVTLPNNSAYRFTADAIGKHSANATAAGWRIEGVVRRGANAASVALVGTPTSQSWADAGASTWTVVMQVNTTNGSLEILVTGEAAKTINWSAAVTTVEVVD